LWTGWVPKTDVFLAVFADTGSVTPKEAATEFKAGLQYLIATNGAALVVGGTLHGIVRFCQLDLRWERLRFNNEWHYLFSGEAWLYETDQATDIDFVFVSVVVEQGDDSILYWGLLSDYVFDRTGALDKIVLTDAQRRFLGGESDRDREPSEEETQEIDLPLSSDRYYSIRGEYFVIEYEGVQTLNVEYYQVLDEE